VNAAAASQEETASRRVAAVERERDTYLHERDASLLEASTLREEVNTLQQKFGAVIQERHAALEKLGALEKERDALLQEAVGLRKAAGPDKTEAAAEANARIEEGKQRIERLEEQVGRKDGELLALAVANEVRECVDVLCSNVEMGDALLQREQAKKSLTFQNATSDAKVLGKLRAMETKAKDLQEELDKVKQSQEEVKDHAAKVAAIEEQRRSAEVVRKLHEELAVLYNNHAAALKKAGDTQKAVNMYRKAVALRAQVSGENSADGATSMINLGSTLMTLHDAAARAEAGGLFKKAWDIRKAEFGDDHASTQAASKWFQKWDSAHQKPSRDPSATASTGDGTPVAS